MIGKKVLAEELVLPAAVLYRDRVANNIRWMQRYAEQCDVRLAPHGKTTMTPALFKLQMQAGAWGMTLATVEQLSAAYANGINRLLLANQLVGKANMAVIADILAQGDAEIYCLVDSADNVAALDAYFGTDNLSLKVLIELGVAGGRCGCRSAGQVDAVQRAVAESEVLQLAGIEFYEGIIQGERAEEGVRELVQFSVNTCLELMGRGAFDTDRVLLTGAGSAWYDLVAETLAAMGVQETIGSGPGKKILPLLRPGCYLIQDQGIYQAAQEKVLRRSQVACGLGGDLVSSLEVWAYVLSIPEPGSAIIGMGKRNVAYDAGLPVPVLSYRQGWHRPVAAHRDWRISKIMDQHAYLDFPPGGELAVGDMVGFSSSHPCLTLDKWRHLYLVDEELKVVEEMTTCFQADTRP